MSRVGDKANLFLKLLSPSLQTKVLCIAILVLYFISLKQELIPFFVCIPYYVKPPYFRIWTLITSNFVEFRFIFVIVDIFCLLASASILEPLWGVMELFLFLIIISFLTASLNLTLCFILSAVTYTFHSRLINMVEIYGASAVLCGLAVSLKQVRPDFELSLVPPISFRLKHLPFLCIVVTLVFTLLEFIPVFSIFSCVSSLVISWSYLRFVQRRDSDIRGDQTETFEFATLFPEALHPCLYRIGSVMGSILRFLKLYPATHRTYDLGVPSEVGLLLPMTVSTSTDRRKQKAQKDLEERLSRTVNKSEEEWPDMSEPDPHSGPSPPIKEEELESVVVVGDKEAEETEKL